MMVIVNWVFICKNIPLLRGQAGHIGSDAKAGCIISLTNWFFCKILDSQSLMAGIHVTLGDTVNLIEVRSRGVKVELAKWILQT